MNVGRLDRLSILQQTGVGTVKHLVVFSFVGADGEAVGGRSRHRTADSIAAPQSLIDGAGVLSMAELRCSDRHPENHNHEPCQVLHTIPSLQHWTGALILRTQLGTGPLSSYGTEVTLDGDRIPTRYRTSHSDPAR